MELKPKDLLDWIPGRMPDPVTARSPFAILLCGTDEGGISAMAKSLFAPGANIEDVTADAVTADTLSMMLRTGDMFAPGSSVLLRGATDKHRKMIEEVLAGGGTESSRLVLACPDLKAQSKLARLFADRDDCMMACLYQLRDREMEAFLSKLLSDHGLRLERGAGTHLEALTNGGRAELLRAGELLALHAHAHSAGTVRCSDLVTILDPAGTDQLSLPLDHAIDGRAAEAQTQLALLLANGENPIALLRIFTQKIFRLLDMSLSGLAPAEAVQRARPPVFWTERDATIRRLGQISPPFLNRVLAAIDECETRIVLTGQDAALCLSYLILSVSRKAC